MRRSRINGTDLEVVELQDTGLNTLWQQFQLSGAPDLISSMNLCYVLHAFAASPLLDRIRRGQDGPGLVAGLDERLSLGLLRYLVLKGVLSEWKGAFALTAKGDALTSDVALARVGFYVEAYGPVLTRIPDLLRADAVYGRDVTRAGGALSRHSGTIFSRYYTPMVLSAMRSGSARRLLDLGCGSGQLLVDACLQDPEVSGVGIDISEDAVEVANDLARRHGVDDRLSFVVADAFDPSTWPDMCKESEMVSMVGVLHEHLRDGQDAVVKILDTYTEMLRGDRRMLIGEPEPFYDDRENDSDFLLVHLLTEQGLPVDRREWLQIFERSRLRCTRIITRAVAGPRMCFYELAAAN